MTSTGDLIPIPDSFPIEWPEPAMRELYWVWDQVHHPHPKTPLSATYEATAFSEGTSSTATGMTV